MLRGAAAVGKSRFAYELVKRLVDEFGMSTATAHCVENASLSAFAAEVAQVAGVHRQNLPARWEQLCSRAARLVSESYAERARRHLPLLALLLGCEGVDTGSIRQADAGSFIHSVKLALRACCEVTAHFTDRPIALVIEDLQWMGGLREVIADISHHACLPQPLIVISTARPEFEADTDELDGLAGPGAHRLLELPPLARTEGGQLIRELLPDLGLPPSLAIDLESKADGIPYYYEEFARLALASGLVTERDGQLTLGEHAAQAQLPDDVRAMIENRLARLDPELRNLTGQAAVIGRSFSGERLRKLAEGLGLTAAGKLASGLAALQQQQLMASDVGDRYFFEHVLARDAAYASISDEQRAELHSTMANLLEDMLVPGTTSEWDILPELISHLAGGARYLDAHMYACELLEFMSNTGRNEGWEERFCEAVQMWELHDGGEHETPTDQLADISPNAEPGQLPRSPALHLAVHKMQLRQGHFSRARLMRPSNFCRKPWRSARRLNTRMNCAACNSARRSITWQPPGRLAVPQCQRRQ